MPSKAKTRAQTHCICSKKNCALIFKISLPQENFVSGGLQSGAWISCWDIFNDHLCSYMIDTDMRECILSCVRVHVISRAQNVVKNMRIMPILAPWILIFQSGALILFKTSSMTIYGHIWLKLIFQHAFWRVLGFMVISSAKNRSKYLKIRN